MDYCHFFKCYWNTDLIAVDLKEVRATTQRKLLSNSRYFTLTKFG